MKDVALWMGENQNKTGKVLKMKYKERTFFKQIDWQDRNMGNSLISLSSLFINSIVT